MDDRKIKEARAKAKKEGIKGEIYLSKAKNKRFAIMVDDKIINFGVWPYAGKGTYLDHKDDKIREAWRSRHSKILKDGKPAYLNKNSPEYYSWRILW
jgi:hypothetical protein